MKPSVVHWFALCVLTAPLCSLPAAHAAPSADPVVEPGSILRVGWKEGGRVEKEVGLLRGQVADSLDLASLNRNRPQSWRIATRDVVHVERSRGRSSKTWLGLGLGLVGGALATALHSTEDDGGPGVFLALVYVPVGMIAGGLIGGGSKSYHWETVSPTARFAPPSEFIATDASAGARISKTAPDGRTVGTLIHETAGWDEKGAISVATKIRIMRGGKYLRDLEPGGFIRSWAFVNDGKAVVVYAGGLHFAGFYVLYDVATAKEIGRAEDPVTDDSPDWVKALTP